MASRNLEIRELGPVYGIYDYDVEMWCTNNQGDIIHSAIVEVVDAHLFNIKANYEIYDARKEHCACE